MQDRHSDSADTITTKAALRLLRKAGLTLRIKGITVVRAEESTGSKQTNAESTVDANTQATVKD